MLRPAGLDAVARASPHDGAFEQVHVALRAEGMPLQIDYRVCDELARAVEGRLAAAQGFLEFGAGGCEVLFLCRCDGADFAAAAGVDWVELRGDDCGWDRWDGCWRGFVGEEVGGEGALEGAGVGVAG